MSFAVRAEGLGKRYRLGENVAQYRLLSESISTAARSVARLGGRDRARRRAPDYLWALRGASFEVAHGEVLGIVGRNGAGKTTLLKLLSRIMEPTEGRAFLRGRVRSLLEVGTGFHPELTGRENVYLNGAILGMRRREIADKFDEIVEFAEVERFVDTPVKRYSSGMYLRLAFSVAAHLEPDILIVDEVLAVGDVAFQQKCLGKMGEAATSGRTVLFVSHNIQAVKSLCSRAILIEKGALVLDAGTEEVLRAYLANPGESGIEKVWPAGLRPGNDQLELAEMRVGQDVPGTAFLSSKPITISFELDVKRPVRGLCVGFDLTTFDGALVLRSFHNDAGGGDVPPGRHRFECVIPDSLLNGGRYLLSPRIAAEVVNWVVNEDAVVQFDLVFDHGTETFVNPGGRPGVVAPRMTWRSVPLGS